MSTITTTKELAEFCLDAARQDYVTVDTEFLRERSYYAKLCLVQLAFSGHGEERAVLVDTLADGLDLAPLYELFRNRDVVKVFHAARQDLEIFWVDGEVIPDPLFDTQIAAMVCGFGEQVGYETLVRKIAKQSLDKSSRFTDWSRRPLSDKQMDYALADVTHLRDIYLHLSQMLDKTGRRTWVEEELAVLTDPETYIMRPEEAWMRLRTRSNSPRFLAVARELAQFREAYAQERDVPRTRVFKDDALMELAATKPKSMSDLSKSRLLLREARKGEIADGILTAVKTAEAIPNADLPKVPKERLQKQGSEGLADLLRVLLKARAGEAGVALKLIATSADLDAIAVQDKPQVAALRGWRADVFGKDALRLKRGEIALSADGDGVKIVDV